jgi:hypothetical protein
MKVATGALYQNGTHKILKICDECGAEPDGLAPIAVWCLSCGHHICTDCGQATLRRHTTSCTQWKLGEGSGEGEDEEALASVEQGGVWSPLE